MLHLAVDVARVAPNDLAACGKYMVASAVELVGLLTTTQSVASIVALLGSSKRTRGEAFCSSEGSAAIAALRALSITGTIMLKCREHLTRVTMIRLICAMLGQGCVDIISSVASDRVIRKVKTAVVDCKITGSILAKWSVLSCVRRAIVVIKTDELVQIGFVDVGTWFRSCSQVLALADLPKQTSLLM